MAELEDRGRLRNTSSGLLPVAPFLSESGKEGREVLQIFWITYNKVIFMKCPFHLSSKVRSDLPPLTARIAKLPVDPERGYPIPFFVSYVGGKPEFRLADSKKWLRCVKEHLCWVCGEPLGVNKAFVIGPMCSINRISADPPTHLDCAEWSVKGCPFLTKPQMVRREDELTQANEDNVSGIMIKRNPGVMLIWTTKKHSVISDHNGGYLFSLGDPESLSWWREGRVATRSEIMESIETGLPNLQAMAEKDGPDAIEELNAAHRRALKLVPAA